MITDNINETLSSIGQDHVFRFWKELNNEERKLLLKDLENLNIDDLKQAISDINNPVDPFTNSYTCNGVKAIDATKYDSEKLTSMSLIGEALLNDKRVAAFTVAGGQGTRLGHHGPKGTVECTPLTKKTLFQHFAETLKFFENRFGDSPRWFIMTSEDNHSQTIRFFSKNNFFGLSDRRVTFFKQGMMPAFDSQGKILLNKKYRIAQSPNGHGGCFRALVESGSTQIMDEEGIDCVSYFQVDNPLVYCIDPVFLGYHKNQKSEMSSKSVKKISYDEKVGTFVDQGDSLRVLEYSDISENLAKQKDEKGELKLGMGSVAIHILECDFIKRIGSKSKEDHFRLPYHGALKKVSYIDDKGNLIEPEKPNAIKPETFVFDALPLSSNPLLFEVDRREEFAPIKNATGVDSISSSLAMQSKRYARWLHASGLKNVPEKIEISPLFAPTSRYFLEKFDGKEKTKHLETPETLLISGPS